MNGQRSEGPGIQVIGKELLPLIIGEIASESRRRLSPQFLQPQWPKSHGPVAACRHEPNGIRAKDGVIDGAFVPYKLHLTPAPHFAQVRLVDRPATVGTLRRAAPQSERFPRGRHGCQLRVAARFWHRSSSVATRAGTLVRSVAHAISRCVARSQTCVLLGVPSQVWGLTPLVRVAIHLPSGLNETRMTSTASSNAGSDSAPVPDENTRTVFPENAATQSPSGLNPTVDATLGSFVSVTSLQPPGPVL